MYQCVKYMLHPEKYCSVVTPSLHLYTSLGEKPHRCQLCPFASAYERHLEAHMRSHTGEKPYKCDLCPFRCSDRSNLSHHRRRRHKLVPARGVRSPFPNKRMLSTLQKRTGSLGFSRRLFLNPPSTVMPKSDYLNDLPHKLHHHLNSSDFKNLTKVEESDGGNRDTNDFTYDNPLDQLSTLAGQLADPPASQTPSSPDRDSLKDVKPILIHQVSGAPVSLSPSGMLRSPAKDESPPLGRGSCSPAPGLSFDNRLSASVTNSQPSTPTPALTATDQQLLHKCLHCDILFSDNVLYTIHMGCHGYDQPFQCNICGSMCIDKYDFACHFARGQHKKWFTRTMYVYVNVIFILNFNLFHSHIHYFVWHLWSEIYCCLIAVVLWLLCFWMDACRRWTKQKNLTNKTVMV